MKTEGPGAGERPIHTVRVGGQEVPPVKGASKIQRVFKSAIDKLADTALAFFMASLEAYLGKVQKKSAKQAETPEAEVPPKSGEEQAETPEAEAPPKTGMEQAELPPEAEAPLRAGMEPAEAPEVEVPQKSEEERQKEIKGFEEMVQERVNTCTDQVSSAKQRVDWSIKGKEVKEAELKEVKKQLADTVAQQDAGRAVRLKKNGLERRKEELQSDLDALEDPDYLNKLKLSQETELKGLLDTSSSKKVEKKFENLTRDDVAKAFGMAKSKTGWLGPTTWTNRDNIRGEQALELFDQVKNPQLLKSKKQGELNSKLVKVNHAIDGLELGLRKSDQPGLQARFDSLSNDLRKLEREIGELEKDIERDQGRLKDAEAGLVDLFNVYDSNSFTAYINNLAAQGRVARASVVGDVMVVLIGAVPNLDAAGARTWLEAHVEAHVEELEFPLEAGFDEVLALVDELAQLYRNYSHG